MYLLNLKCQYAIKTQTYNAQMKKVILVLSLLIQFLFSQRVVGYYPHWVFNNFAPEEIDLGVVTHVIHAFAWPNPDGSIDSYDGMIN